MKTIQEWIDFYNNRDGFNELNFDELNELYSYLQRCHYEEIYYAKYEMEKELQETVEFRIKIMKEIYNILYDTLLSSPNCWDVLKEYFTDEEIREAKEKLVACGCSVCCINYLTGKFPDRVPKEKLCCFGT